MRLLPMPLNSLVIHQYELFKKLNLPLDQQVAQYMAEGLNRISTCLYFNNFNFNYLRKQNKTCIFWNNKGKHFHNQKQVSTFYWNILIIFVFKSTVHLYVRPSSVQTNNQKCEMCNRYLTWWFAKDCWFSFTLPL